MYKRGKYIVECNEPLTQSVYRMRLSGDTQYVTASGQFINIAIEGLYLRRPISVCDYDERTITIVYKVVGRGTEAMKAMSVGQELDILTGLGNGFDHCVECHEPLLVGGGVGVPPLYNLCKKLLAIGKNPKVLLGFNTASELFMKEEFEQLGVEVSVTTVDGSMGIKGFVVDALASLSYDYLFTCGPLPMLRALYDSSEGVGGQYSFEERMGCGFGACVGCTCKTKYGNKRICKDGPVLDREEIIW